LLKVSKVCVPPSTPDNAPITQYVSVPAGELVRVDVRIPPGHLGLTGIRVLRGIEIIIPWHQDDWLVGDNETITDNPLIRCEDDPTTLTIQAYNLDETYIHCFYVRFEVLPYEKVTHNVIVNALKRLRLLR